MVPVPAGVMELMERPEQGTVILSQILVIETPYRQRCTNGIVLQDVSLFTYLLIPSMNWSPYQGG